MTPGKYIVLSVLGECLLYFGMLDRGVPYLILSTILLFLLQDGLAYYVHRMSHRPFFYKLYHKMHHRSARSSMKSYTLTDVTH